MPEKHPNTVRWGEPGAAHEDATKPMPEPAPAHPPGAVSTSPRVSQVSGGGGERDEKHSHVDDLRSAKSHATDSPSPTSTREWRENRSRNDRERDRMEAAGDEHPDGSETADDPAPAPDGPPGSERGLQILVNTDNHVSGAEGVTREVEQTVRSGLRRFGAQITHVEVYLTDENASKSGPGDKRCSIEARPRGADPLTASDEGSSINQAVGGALRKLQRVLDSELGKRRDHKGGETIRGGF